MNGGVGIKIKDSGMSERIVLVRQSKLNLLTKV